METLEISSRRPNANVGAKRQSRLLCSLHVPASRTRPPKHVQMKSHAGPPCGPFDSVVATRALRVAEQRAVSPCSQSAPVVNGFGPMCRMEQQRLLAYSGLMGPIDICVTSMIPLFLAWCCSKRVEIPWSHVEKKWHVGCAPAFCRST